jgi:hypothetical protein
MKWVDEWNEGITAMADEVGIKTKYVKGGNWVETRLAKQYILIAESMSSL